MKKNCRTPAIPWGTLADPEVIHCPLLDRKWSSPPWWHSLVFYLLVGKEIFQPFFHHDLPLSLGTKAEQVLFFHRVDELMEVQIEGHRPQSKAYPGSSLLCQTLTPPLTDGMKRWKHQGGVWGRGCWGNSYSPLFVMFLTLSIASLLDGSHWVLTMFPQNTDWKYLMSVANVTSETMYRWIISGSSFPWAYRKKLEMFVTN